LGARFDNTQRAARWVSQRGTELKHQAATASAHAEAVRKANGLAPGASAPSGAGEPSKDVLRKAEELEAAALAKKNLYESLLTRYQRVTQFVQQMFPITEARVLKRATPPPTRSSPKLALTLLLALFAGGILGTSGAFALEYFDRRIRNVDQLEASLGVRCLALLPPPDRSWRRSQANGAPVNMAWPLDDRQTFVAEGQAAGDVIRGVKLALDRARGGRADEGRIFAIASPFMGDEAASLATALAAIAARRGDRVLLITDDAPMRSAADTERPRPQGNLPYALSGANGEPLDALVHHDLGFDVFCKSAQSQRAGDLFMSAAGHGLVKRLRAAYDCVLISLPPVLERVDAVASAEFVDGFVLVANAGNTTLDDVDRALSVSALLTERLVGMVLFKAGAAPALHSV
jgi:succinoglycan biosynthesis transport protein ExoP